MFYLSAMSSVSNDFRDIYWSRRLSTTFCEIGMEPYKFKLSLTV